MPLYEFQCDECGEIFELVYSLAACPVYDDCPDPQCEGAIKKLISPPGCLKTDHPAWLNDHVRAVLQKEGEKPIETRTEHDRYLKQNGYIQRC